MSRAFDFVLVGVIYIIAAIVHLMAIELFAPGTPLYEFAASATNLNGAERADLWFQIIAIWVPLIAMGGITAYAVIREYRRQATTGVRRVA